MNPCSEVIKDLLVTGGVGTFGATTGWGIFMAEEPVSPDTCITVYDVQAGPPQFFADTALNPIEGASPQVRVRALGYLAGITKIEACRDAIRLVNTEIGGVRYLLIRGQGSWLYLGKDERERFLFVQNFQVQRCEISS